MSKISLAASQTEALYRFIQVLDCMGYRNNETKPCKVLETRESHDDTVRIRICTFVCSTKFEGEVVLKTYYGQWQIYCAASYIEFGRQRLDFSYDYDEQKLGVRQVYMDEAYQEVQFEFASNKKNFIID